MIDIIKKLLQIIPSSKMGYLLLTHQKMIVFLYSAIHSLKKFFILFTIEIVIEMHMYVHTKLWCRHIMDLKCNTRSDSLFIYLQ